MPYALRKNHPCPNCKNRGQLSYMWANGQANGQDMLRCDVCGFVAMDGQMIGGDDPMPAPPVLRSAAEIRERITKHEKFIADLLAHGNNILIECHRAKVAELHWMLGDEEYAAWLNTLRQPPAMPPDLEPPAT